MDFQRPLYQLKLFWQLLSIKIGISLSYYFFIHTDVIIFSIRVSDVMPPLIPEVGAPLDWAKKVFEKTFQNESVTWVPW